MKGRRERKRKTEINGAKGEKYSKVCVAQWKKKKTLRHTPRGVGTDDAIESITCSVAGPPTRSDGWTDLIARALALYSAM